MVPAGSTIGAVARRAPPVWVLVSAAWIGPAILAALARTRDAGGAARGAARRGPLRRPPGADAAALPAEQPERDQSKDPASLAFLLMTLGPTIALLPALARARGRLADALAMLGRVPFCFYLLHIPLIHALALAVSLVRAGAVSPWLFENHPMGSGAPPPGYAWSLGLLYAIWALAVGLLHLPCRWFAGVKARRSEWWLRYL
jgi:hypothetical protein